MRKILLFTVILASMSFASIAVEAKTVGSASVDLALMKVQFGPVFQGWRRWDNRNDRFRRERYETRTVRYGNKLYRDTYRITYKNGREYVKRIHHDRIR